MSMNGWIVFGCDECGNDFHFCIPRGYASIDTSCPNCGSENVFETGERVDGKAVWDDRAGEEVTS